MTHITLLQLEAELTKASKRIVIGARYYHYKHPEIPYVVNGLSVLEATDEVAVRYSPESNLRVEFVRPLNSWCDVVSWNGSVVSRFTPF